MLDINKLYEAFERKRGKILNDQAKIRYLPGDYIEAFDDFQQMSRLDILANNPSAIPVVTEQNFILKIKDFNSIREANKWAVSVLDDAVLAAVDGSQIFPSKELSVNIGMVQSSWVKMDFISDKFDYDVKVEIILSDNILKEWDVSLARQKLEVDTAITLINNLDKNAIILLDGTLIYSFLAMVDDKLRKEKIEELVSMLELAEEKEIPVIGYVDTSYAKDLTNTLININKVDSDVISDAGFLNQLMTRLGEYTIPFICKRFPLDEYGSYMDKICFSYMRLHSKRVVRLEFPRWIWDKGIYDDVISKIMAEGILSHGYPRILTRAHEYAVLHGEDREKFNLFTISYYKKLNLKVEEMIKSSNKQRFY